jgi:hypothetical protein
MLSLSCAAGAGYFEICCSALRTALAGGSAESALATAITIPAPLMLPQAQPSSATLIHCSVSLTSGQMQVMSESKSGSSTVHVEAAASSLKGASVQQGEPQRQRCNRATAAALLRSTGAAPDRAVTAAPAAAVALLQSDTQRSGLWLDPAAFDCFLQLGQVFLMAGENRGEGCHQQACAHSQGMSYRALRVSCHLVVNAPPLIFWPLSQLPTHPVQWPPPAEVFVPAGLEALRAHSAAATLTVNSPAWACSVPNTTAQGVVSSNFALSGAMGHPVCSISSLVAKSMGKAASSTARAASNEVRAVECLYEVEWQAATASNDSMAVAAAAGDAFWQLNSAGIDPARAASHAIEAVQRLLKSAPSGTAVQLQTLGAAMALPPSLTAGCLPPPTQLSSSALSGMIKTLSQERPELKWSSSDGDGRAAGRRDGGALVRLVTLPRSGAHVAAADAFGAAVRAATLHTPALLKSLVQEALAPHHLMPLPRGSLNSLTPVPVNVDRPLKSGEVLVEVRAVGLNFRYVDAAWIGDIWDGGFGG